MATRRYHAPRQRERSPLETHRNIWEPDMEALTVIGIFLVVVFALNIVDFGRID